MQIDENDLAIFDIFVDNSGRESHFAAQVAGLQNEQASALVAGGWDEGVVANVSNFDILAIKQITQPYRFASATLVPSVFLFL